MAEPGAFDPLMKALGYAGGGSVLVALGALVRGYLNGSETQYKDLRTGLADRVAALEAKVDHLEQRLEEVGRERDFVRYQRDSARTQRNRAWDRINAFEVQANVPVSQWPTDPPEIGAP